MNPEILAWIEKQKPQLVKWAEAFLKETRIYEEKTNRDGDDDEEAERSGGGDEDSKPPWVRKSQLQNLLGAARAGDPVALLANFLRYQHARLEGWRHNEAAEKLEAVLREKVQPLARQCPHLETPNDESHGEAAIELRYDLEAALAAQLFGFLIREYTYCCKLARTTP